MGQADEATLRAIAPVLDLDPMRWSILRRVNGNRKNSRISKGLPNSILVTRMLVNAFSFRDRHEQAAAFDTGADCAGMLKNWRRKKISRSD